MKNRALLTNVLILAGFLLLPLLLYGGVTLGPNTMLPVDNLFQWEPWAAYADQLGVGAPQNHLISDLILQNYAWKNFVRESLAAGEIPLWNPYLFGGVPFLAAGQHGAYYPFSIFFLVLPLTKAYGWYTVSQLWLAGVSAFIFGRVLGMRRSSAALSGLTFQGCGFILVSAAVFPMVLGAAVWLPLLLAAIELVIRRSAAVQEQLMGKTLPIAALGALALGSQVLAGHIEITYYTLLVMAGYAAWRLIPQLLHGWRQRYPVWRIVKPAAWVGVMVTLGLMVGAIQLIPFYEVGQTNFREGSAPLSEILGYGFPIRRILTLGMPHAFGNPTHHSYLDLFTGERVAFDRNAYGATNPRGAGTSDWGIKNYVEGGIYLGILPLLLAGLGIVGGVANRKRRKHLGFFLLLSFLSLAFIFGTPLYAILYYGLPGINQLHSPFRWVFPLSVSISVLAGFGADFVVLDNQRSRARQIVIGTAVLSLGVGVAVMLGLLLSRLLFNQLAPFMERLFLSLALAPEAFPDARAFYSYEFWQVFVFAAVLMAAGVVLWLSQKRTAVAGHPAWIVVAFLLIVADLWLAGRGFNASVDPGLLQIKPAVLSWLQEQPGVWRLTTFDPKGQKPLNANSAWPYHLEDIRGYESVIPRQYTEYMAAIEPQRELLFNRVQPISNWESLNSPLLDLLGVRFVITQEIIELPKWRLVWEREGLRVYENLSVLPRAYTMTGSSLLVVDDVLETMRSRDPRQYLLISSEDWQAQASPAPDRPPASVPTLPRPASIVSRSNRTVVVDALVEEESWLVLNDSYAQGWKAFVAPLDETGQAQAERAEDLWRVNGTFRAVSLSPGAWRVRFQYSPTSFTLGGLTSFMAGTIIIFTLTVWGWRRFYREEETLSTVRSVAKNSLAPMILNLFNRGIDFVFAAFYLRWLGPGDAGGYATAISIAGLYEIIANWGLNTLIIREVSQEKSQAARYLLNTSLLRIGTGFIAALPVFVYLAGRSLGGNALAADTRAALLLLMIGMIVSGMASGLTGIFYAHEQAEMPATISTVTTILKVGFGVSVLLAGWGFVGLAGVSILVNGVTLLILLLLAFSRFSFDGGWQLDWRLQLSMLKHSYPLMLNHLLATVFFFVDIPLLQQFKGDEPVGWYDSAYKYIKAFNIIPSFFTIALFPVISRQVRESIDAGRRTFRISAKLLALLALPLAAVTTLLAPLLIGALGGEAYLPDGAIALQLIVWSIPIGWLNSVTNYVLIALGQERLQTRAFAAGVGFNLVANLIFIPMFSYRAAAVTTIASEIVLLTIFHRYLVRKMPDIGWFSLMWRPALATGIMIAGMGLASQIHWSAALSVGVTLYVGSLFLLRVFGEEERHILADLMPASLAARLQWGSQA